MRLNQLEYLDAIAHYGTFSKAAQALYLSQPSLSVGIRELEEELGYPLLVRGGRKLQFTPEGELVLERAQNIPREIESIRRIEHAPDGSLTGTVSIGSTPHFCNSLLLDVMMNLKPRHPRLHLVLEEDDSAGVIESVRAGRLQLGVIQLCDVDEESFLRDLARGALHYDELFPEEMCCVVGERHPLAGQERVTADALFEYHYATFRRARNSRVVRLLQRSGLGDDRIVRIEEIDLLRRYLIRSNSFTVIPRRALYFGNSSFADNLAALPVDELACTTRVGVVRSTAAVTPAEQAVLTELLRQCESYG